MFRSHRVPALLPGLVAALSIAACGSSSSSSSSTGTGDAALIGTPCSPSPEASTMFSYFDEKEITVQQVPGKSTGDLVCLVNHFRGRVSCPYGQDAAGHAPAGAQPCTVDGAPVTGGGAHDAHAGPKVLAQCTDRRAKDTVIYSCRCGNAAGRTDDGATYCTCGSGTTCATLVTSTEVPELSGAYCIKQGTDYQYGSACQTSCDPSASPCD